MAKAKSDFHRRVAGDISRAVEFLEDGEVERAQVLLTRMRQWALAEKLPHGEISYLLSVAHDREGQSADAIEMIQEALQFAPLDPRYWQSFDVIMRQARLRLRRQEHRDEVPEIYAALQEAGEASMDCHVEMARFKGEQDDTAGALRLVDGVLALSPGHEGARSLGLEIATELEDDALIERYQDPEAVLPPTELRPTQAKALA